ncbi:tripartite tricarboxylate transporter TctB family protein [Arthrobacter pigmenti]
MDAETEQGPDRGGIFAAAGAALAPLLVGIGGIVVSLGLGIGTLGAPGPGLWPLIVSLFLLIIAANGLFHVKKDEDVESFGKGLPALGVGILTLVIYAVLFPRIGFEIPTALLLLFWIKVLGREGWRVAISVAVIATVAIYVLFIMALGVTLPHLF